MAAILTREQLYEMVWTQPRTTLAKSLGVSDVAIGKHCARSGIPAPPPGYWARKQAGKAGRKPPLPVRLPGQSNALTIGPADKTGYPQVSEELTAPTFTESIDEQVEAAMKIMNRVVAFKNLAEPHPVMNRVLKRESRLRDSKWSSEKPIFDDPVHQRQIRIFCGFARAFDRIAHDQSVYETNEFTYGSGTKYFLVMRINLGATTIGLEFLEPGEQRIERAGRVAPRVTATTLVSMNRGRNDPEGQWSDAAHVKLESQLDAIARRLLRDAEEELREAAERRYARAVERRAEEEKIRIAAAREVERQRLAREISERENVRARIVALARSRTSALEIRQLVADLSKQIGNGAEEDEEFRDWKAIALAVADRLDPLKRPLIEICRPTEL